MPNSRHPRRKQRHNAGNLAFDAVVAYPFHPLVGQTVLVVGEQEHNGVRHFLIRQPHDGTLHVPDWMVTPQAGSHAIVATPRIPLNALLELRAILDHLVASSVGDSTPKGGDEDANEDPAADAIRSVRHRHTTAQTVGRGEAEGNSAVAVSARRSGNHAYCRPAGSKTRGGAR